MLDFFSFIFPFLAAVLVGLLKLLKSKKWKGQYFEPLGGAHVACERGCGLCTCRGEDVER
jgi:hypothetical protein